MGAAGAVSAEGISINATTMGAVLGGEATDADPIAPSPATPIVGGTAQASAAVSAPWVWCLIFGLAFCTRASLVQLLPLYSKLARFSFSPTQLGVLTSLSYGTKWTALIVLVPALVHWARDPQVGTLRAVRLGVTIGAAAVASVGLCRNTPELFVAVSAEGFSQLMTPATRALVVSSAPLSQSGRVLGYVANVEMLCSIVTPLLAGSVYTATVSSDPALGFFIISGTVGLGAITVSMFAAVAPPAPRGDADGKARALLSDHDASTDRLHGLEEPPRTLQ